MKINYLFSLLLSAVLAYESSAQWVSGFENYPIDSSGIYVGSSGSAGFEDNGHFFRNDYNSAFQSWNGFALSRKTDSVTAGYGNQFSCRAGRAGEGSSFALAYASSRIFIRKAAAEPKRRALRFWYCNNTYAAKSMQLGDAFAKKFGGPDGTDPDFFSLTVYNYLNGSITDSSTFYLADFRAAGTANDFILTSWTEANLNFSSPFDSIGFELRSSDIGSFGMNTPAYFCMDNLESEAFASVSANDKIAEGLFPNPAQGKSWLHTARETEWQISDAAGRIRRSGRAAPGTNPIDLSGLNAGFYQMRLTSGRSFHLIVR